MVVVDRNNIYLKVCHIKNKTSNKTSQDRHDFKNLEK